MFVPAHPLPVFEALGELFFSFYCRKRGLKRPGKKNGTALVGHAKSLFFAETEFFCRRIVSNKAAGGLRAKPFANVTLRCASFFSELGRSLRSRRGKPEAADVVKQANAAFPSWGNFGAATYVATKVVLDAAVAASKAGKLDRAA